MERIEQAKWFLSSITIDNFVSETDHEIPRIPEEALEEPILPREATLSLPLEPSAGDFIVFKAFPRQKSYLSEPNRHSASSTLEDARIFVSSQRGSILGVFSVMAYSNKSRKKSSVINMESLSSPVAPISASQERKNASSFAYLVSQTDSAKSKFVYDPEYLDDPQLRSGKHKTLMNLPSFLSSVISYVTDEELREEINYQFRLQHPWIDPSMSLTKIRKIKLMFSQLAADSKLNLELSTAALACIYFERLVLKNMVVKTNRKIMAAICFMIAMKFHEFSASTDNTDRPETSPSSEDDKSNERNTPDRPPALQKPSFKKLVEAIASKFDVRKRDMLLNEFKVFVALEFDLNCHPDHAVAHLRRFAPKQEVYLSRHRIQDLALTSG
jgi:hypothetical protein